MSRLEALARAFWRGTETPFRPLFDDGDARAARVLLLMRVFYAWLLCFAVWRAPRARFLEPAPFEPMWPVAWLDLLPWEVGAGAIIALCVGGAAWALLFPGRPAARWAAFFGLFLFLALRYSYVGVQHRVYTTLFLAFFLAWAPRLGPGEAPDARRRAQLAAFGGVAFVLFTYSWAGLLKVWGIVDAILSGDTHVLRFDLVPAHLLARAYRFESPPLLAEFVLDHPALASLGFLAVVYVELVSLAAAFRPHLQRWWFAVLAAFHFSTLFAMKVFFLPATVLLVLLALFTPFAGPPSRWREALREVPWWGPLASAVLSKWDGLRGRATRVELFVPEDGARLRSLLRSRGAMPLPEHAALHMRPSPEFEALCREAPGLAGERAALLSIEHGAGGPTLRRDAEALLHAWSGGSGPRSWAFLAMLVPLPLLGVAFRLAFRRGSGTASLAAGSVAS